MSDAAQRRLERQVKELNEMVKIGLFTPEEISKIVIKRRDMETKIGCSKKSLFYFMQYIEYEKRVLRLVGLRRLKFRNSLSKDIIETQIKTRIKRLYLMAMEHCWDFKLFHSYFNYSNKHFKKTMPAVIDLMVKRYSSNEKAWLLAANWQFREGNNKIAALRLLASGVDMTKSPALYLEMITIELQSVHKCEDQEILEKSCLALQKIIEYAYKSVKEVDFYEQVLKLIEEYEFTNNVLWDKVKELKELLEK